MHLGVILLLARRNLRRTLLTATAFIIGGAMLTFSQTFDAGTHEQLIDSGVRTGSGHVSVEGPGFRLSRKIEDCLPGGTLQLVRQAVVSSGVAERVTDVFYRMSVSGLATSASGARPGADPGRRSGRRGGTQSARRAGRRGTLPEEGRPARGLRRSGPR